MNDIKYAIGLMSGTSLDGVDVALVKIEGSGISMQCELMAFDSTPIDDDLRQRILQASDPKQATVDLICSLNVELGALYSQAVTTLLEKISFDQPLDFIASHGQTIYHQPNAKMPLVPSTLQIGDPSQLAYDHKTQVIFNFRMMDMVAGGDGAPLVPYTEFLLYRNSDRSVLLQNIGGIGNVTILPKNCQLNDVSAFDTGPGNMMINSAVMHFYQKPYDHNGDYARQGELIPQLFSQLKVHNYLAKNPPKSTGREQFGDHYVTPLCEEYADRPNDLIRTLTEFTAFTIAQSYRDFIFPTLMIDRIIIGGGGAYNPILMEALRNELPDSELLTQEDLGFSSDAKEAIAFAILGNETLHRNPSNVPKATGAKYPVILGQICPNPWG